MSFLDSALLGDCTPGFNEPLASMHKTGPTSQPVTDQIVHCVTFCCSACWLRPQCTMLLPDGSRSQVSLRVRSQQYVMLTMCACVTRSGSCRGGRPQQGEGGRPPLSRRRPGHSRSRVPLHVQHPEKYTCYVLDEPLLVGGGDKAAGLSSQAELEKV